LEGLTNHESLSSRYFSVSFLVVSVGSFRFVERRKIMSDVFLGLAGAGTIGVGLIKNLQKNGVLLRERTGACPSLRRVAVRDLEKNRGVDLPAEAWTNRWQDLVDDPEIRIVVELMGGIEEPLALIRSAIAAGKTVVTGNKALLAEHGLEIFQQAASAGVPVFYEAAVAGGIPIIKIVREALVGNRLEVLQGILNGTSNYILTQMEATGADYSDVLPEAQRLGYAEADPTLDVNGWDAAHKAIILASLAYGRWISPEQIYVEGIERIRQHDISFARQLGYRIKLLASIRADEAGRISVRVCPTLIPENHVLASVNGVFNAIWLRGDVVGEALFYGRGAGQDPTASSVLADVTEATLALARPRGCPGFQPHDLYGDSIPVAEAVSSWYLRLAVEDRPGVLAQVAGVLGSHAIGISSVIQPETSDPGPIPLVLIIHEAAFGTMQTAVGEISILDCVRDAPLLLQVESPTRS
jgi:homoserine dehydrogenase